MTSSFLSLDSEDEALVLTKRCRVPRADTVAFFSAHVLPALASGELAVARALGADAAFGKLRAARARGPARRTEAPATRRVARVRADARRRFTSPAGSFRPDGSFRIAPRPERALPGAAVRRAAPRRFEVARRRGVDAGAEGAPRRRGPSRRGRAPTPSRGGGRSSRTSTRSPSERARARTTPAAAAAAAATFGAPARGRDGRGRRRVGRDGVVLAGTREPAVPRARRAARRRDAPTRGERGEEEEPEGGRRYAQGRRVPPTPARAAGGSGRRRWRGRARRPCAYST